jgi:hypothetical protein
LLFTETLRDGQRCFVFALVVDGQSEALDYLNELYELQKGDYNKMKAVIDLLGDLGFIANREKFNRLDDGIYEMKLRRPAQRLFCFQDGRNWICTHGDRKPGKAELRGHIDKVRALRQRYLEDRR